MTIKEAQVQAKVDAVRENYERLSQREDWATMTKDARYCLMQIECGSTRPVIALVLKELGIEL